MKFLTLLTLFISTLVSAAPSIEYKKSTSSINNILSKMSLSYFMNFSGPTLKGRKGDETYSKFQTGTDSQGGELDGNQSINAFHAVSVNYQHSLNTSLTLAFAYDTFHGDDVSFKYPNGYEDKRITRGSQYDPRLTAFFSNIYTNPTLSFSSGIGFEVPMIQSSIDNKLQTTLILTPSIALKKIPNKFFVGVSSMIEKYFYEDQTIVNDFYIKTLAVTVAPYLNYQINDRWQFRSRLEFDWDQRAEQTNTTELGNNMVNSYRLGFAHRLNNNISWGSHLEAIIGDTKLETTSVGAFLGLRL